MIPGRKRKKSVSFAENPEFFKQLDTVKKPVPRISNDDAANKAEGFQGPQKPNKGRTTQTPSQFEKPNVMQPKPAGQKQPLQQPRKLSEKESSKFSDSFMNLGRTETNSKLSLHKGMYYTETVTKVK